MTHFHTLSTQAIKIRHVCQAHTGQLGRNNRNRGEVDRVNGDWAGLVEYVERTLTTLLLSH